MSLNSHNRAVRALLWLVIVFAPGGLLLLAVLAADSVTRRYREGQPEPKTDRTDPRLGEPASSHHAA
jgi:hypothetical protein